MARLQTALANDHRSPDNRLYKMVEGLIYKDEAAASKAAAALRRRITRLIRKAPAGARA